MLDRGEKGVILQVSMEPRSFDHGDGYRDDKDDMYRMLFQWSHDLSIMETYKEEKEVAHKFQVSMEPRSFDHGDSTLCSNHLPYQRVRVSMEPRSFDHGDC